MGSIGVDAALAAVRADLAALADVDLGALTHQQQLDALLAIYRLVNQVQAVESRLVATVHRSGAAAVEAATSTAAWLRARLHVGDAARRLAAATALEHLPQVADRYAAGGCGLEQVAAIATVLPDLPEPVVAEVDKLLAELAVELPASGLRRACTRIREHVVPDTADARYRERWERRWLSVARTFDGAVAVNGMLDPEGGEQVLTALTAFMPPPVEDDTRTAAQRRADALVELCEHASPETAIARPRLTVTVDLAELRGQPRDLRTRDGRWTGATFGSGEPVDAATLRRLACDASLVPAVLAGRANRWTWDGHAGWCPSHSAARWRFGTVTVAFRVVTAQPRGPTPTTPRRGPRVAAPTWTRWSCCAGDIT
jgi:hypothetical protein